MFRALAYTPNPLPRAWPCLFGLLLWLGFSGGGQTALALQATQITSSAPLPSPTQPGARLAFPNQGVVNAFVIFVQHADEPDGAGDFGDDPATEWPFAWGLAPDHRLPTWARDGAFLAPPGTPPDAFDEGSLSAFYHLMSRGRFHLTGHVYPQVYIPRHPVDWYHENRGSFLNGAVALSHEILTSGELQAYFLDNPDGLDRAALDTYVNGTNTYAPGGDGLFDLVILVFRSPSLPRLRLDFRGRRTGGSSITSLGADQTFRPDQSVDYADPTTNTFADAPVTLGGLRVVDNLTSGSGILLHAVTRKQAVRLAAHEIGHRHFGFYHTCDSPLSTTADCLGLMGGAFFTMSAGDRIKLGWADVLPLDVPTLGRLSHTFPDALQSGQVFRIRQGQDECGDVIVEARFWSNFWDSPPNPDDPAAPFYGNDDGDGNDVFLPQEGLYLYKAPIAGAPRCGGNRDPAFDFHLFSSLENNGLTRRLTPFEDGLSNDLNAFRVGGTYKVAYTPGDTYAPFTRPRFSHYRSDALDEKLTLTAITRHADAFEAEIWTDHLVGPPDAQRLLLTPYPNPFSGTTTIRYELTDEAYARLSVYDLWGRHLATLAEGRHQPGVHEVPFAADGLPSGLYWCRIELGDRTHTAPLYVVK